MTHPFFNTVDWIKLIRKDEDLEIPFKPNISTTDDVTYIEPQYLNEKIDNDSDIELQYSSTKLQEAKAAADLFKDFSFEMWFKYINNLN